MADARVLFHNVGHGQAVHVFAADGKVIVIDLGCSTDFSPLEWLSKNIGKTIDLLVITHPHGDHIDEILLLDKLGITVRQLWRPKWLTEQEVRDANQVEYKEKVDRYLEMSARYTTTPPPNEVVGNPDCTGGLSLSTYATATCARTNINNHSGVVVMKYAQSTVVVPGDNEPPSWRALLDESRLGTHVNGSDIFLASHHGRESGYCAEIFAQERKPNLFAVSDGPVQDTDATKRYSPHANGWKVMRASGEVEDRKVVTTRTDGYIDVRMWMQNAQPYLSVKTGK